MTDVQLLEKASEIQASHPYDVVLRAIAQQDPDIRDAIDAHGVYKMIRETGLLPRYVRHYVADVVCEFNNPSLF